GSQVSPRRGSTQPSPHTEVRQWPSTHTPLAPQAEQAAGGALTTQRWPWPVPAATVVAVQVFVPRQKSTAGHESGAVGQLNLQLVSQPVPGPLAAPKSQSSPGSMTPLPHVAAAGTQAPLRQWPPPAQAVPSASGVPGAQTCVAPLHVPCPLHESAGVQLRVA